MEELFYGTSRWSEGEGKEEDKRGEGKRKKGKRDKKSELEKVEIERVMNGLRNRKGAGVDRIANEVWKFGGEKVKKRVWDFYNRVWKEKG